MPCRARLSLWRCGRISSRLKPCTIGRHGCPGSITFRGIFLPHSIDKLAERLRHKLGESRRSIARFSTPLFPVNTASLDALKAYSEAERMAEGLVQMQKDRPEDTLWKLVWAPMIGAEIAMAAHDPHQAVILFQNTHVLDSRDLDLPAHRGNIYLAAGRPELAEKEFRYVLAHPELDPVTAAYPLAWLGLGRALLAEGDRSGAAQAYQHFLGLWAHADPDAAFLNQGKQEFAALQLQQSGL
jgi:predicted Zn-dependent protease